QLEIYPGAYVGAGQPLLVNGRVARVVPDYPGFVVGVALDARFNAVCTMRPEPQKSRDQAPQAAATPPPQSRGRNVQWRWISAVLLALLLLLQFGRDDASPAAMTAANASIRGESESSATADLQLNFQDHPTEEQSAPDDAPETIEDI